MLNRYRNLVRDWEDSADVAEAVIEVPTLFMGGERGAADPRALAASIYLVAATNRAPVSRPSSPVSGA